MAGQIREIATHLNTICGPGTFTMLGEQDVALILEKPNAKTLYELRSLSDRGVLEMHHNPVRKGVVESVVIHQDSVRLADLKRITAEEPVRKANLQKSLPLINAIIGENSGIKFTYDGAALSFHASHLDEVGLAATPIMLKTLSSLIAVRGIGGWRPEERHAQDQTSLAVENHIVIRDADPRILTGYLASSQQTLMTTAQNTAAAPGVHPAILHAAKPGMGTGGRL